MSKLVLVVCSGLIVGLLAFLLVAAKVSFVSLLAGACCMGLLWGWLED